MVSADLDFEAFAGNAAVADLPFTLDQLRILRAIVSEGSFKKAADSLYVTQPAVSLQIQNLEKQLELSLIHI